MNKTIIQIFPLGIITCLSVSCQTPLQKAAPIPIKPFPEWTKKNSKYQSQQEIKISTKFFEITRPLDSPDIPSNRYELKLSNPQFQLFTRQVAQTPKANIITLPSAVTRDGEQFVSEAVENFTYPTSPIHPEHYKNEKIGIVSHTYAKHTAEKNIFFKNSTRISEFIGFSKTQTHFELPIFNRRYSNSSSTLKSGQTFVVGGILDEVSEHIEDKTLLNLFTKRRNKPLSRELIIATTVSLINPDKAIKPSDSITRK